MPLLARLLNVFRNVLARSSAERQLERELETTLEMIAEEKIAAGMSPPEAMREARLLLGGVDKIKEEVREVWIGHWLDTLVRDVRYAARLLWRNPGSTVVVLLILALGIGLTSSVLSIVHSLLLRPLPLSDPDRVVMLWETRPAEGNVHEVVGGHEFPAWQSRSHSFEQLAAVTFSNGMMNLTGAGEPASLFGARVTSNFFAVFGVRPLLGRSFVPDEDKPGQGRVVVLRHDLWQEKFGGDPAIINRPISLNDQSVTVVGVMPPGFAYPVVPVREGGPQLWMPIAEPLHYYRGRHFLEVVGRLRSGVGLAQAQAEMDVLGPELEKEFSDASKGHRIRIVPLQAEIVGEVRPALLVLMSAVTLVLLIGCANVASLLIARGLGRRGELALRMALGADRRRLVRQLLTESLLLSLLGGALGVILAGWILALLPRVNPAEIHRLSEIRMDFPVLAAALGISLLTGLLFGLAPALHAIRTDPIESLRGATRTTAGREPRLRGALVAGEMALTLLLLTAAGLLLRTFDELRRVPLGFNSEDLLVFDLQLPPNRYREAWQKVDFYGRLLGSLRSLPEVVTAGAAADIPLSGSESNMAFTIEGRPRPAPGSEPSAGYRVVSTGYFRAMQIPVLRGRDFGSSDARAALPLIRWWERQPLPPHFAEPQAQPVAIINEEMARRFWPNEEPVGKRIRLLFSPWVTIVGVVGNIHHLGLADKPGPEYYLTDLQEPQSLMNIVVRTRVEPGRLAEEMRKAVWALDRELPVNNLRPMDSIVSNTLARSRFLSFLVGLFAALALLLTTVGIYGLVSYSVSRQTHEIGVRLALGGEPARIMLRIVRQSVTLACAGVFLGLGGAWALTRLLKKLLFQVEPTDPLTFLSVSLIVGAAAVLASYLPARRALRVDPVVSLRCE